MVTADSALKWDTKAAYRPGVGPFASGAECVENGEGTSMGGATTDASDAVIDALARPAGKPRSVAPRG